MNPNTVTRVCVYLLVTFGAALMLGSLVLGGVAAYLAVQHDGDAAFAVGLAAVAIGFFGMGLVASFGEAAHKASVREGAKSE